MKGQAKLELCQNVYMVCCQEHMLQGVEYKGSGLSNVRSPVYVHCLLSGPSTARLGYEESGLCAVCSPVYVWCIVRSKCSKG